MKRLAIFVRYPVPGQTKTRLIPALGAAGAARLAHTMTLQTLATARAFRQRGGAEIEVRFTGATREQMATLYGDDLAYVAQGEGDLGERLARAADGGETMLIGSDCPGLDVGGLVAAGHAMDQADVVLGPAADGGYYLIGLRRYVPEMFRAIPWSTPAVLQHTAAAVRQQGLSVMYLPELRDVDEPGDLAVAGKLITEPAEYRPGRIALTGATGCLGLHFMEQMLSRDPHLQVTALVRADSPRRLSSAFQRILALYGRRIELIEGDITSLSRLTWRQRRHLGQADGGLWHFAACTQLVCRDAHTEGMVWHTNLMGTRQVLELLASCWHPGPLMHISTAYVCGRRTGVVCESELDRGSGFRNTYEAAKAEAEHLVREAFAAGLHGAVFRPSVVVGRQASTGGLKVVDSLADAIAGAIRRQNADGCYDASRLTLRVEPKSGINAVDREWVIARMIELAGTPGERTYHLTARNPLQMEQLAGIVASIAPGFQLRLEPGISPLELHGVSRLIDRAIMPYLDYLQAAPMVQFDRIHTDLYAQGACACELDVVRRLGGSAATDEISRVIPAGVWPA